MNGIVVDLQSFGLGFEIESTEAAVPGLLFDEFGVEVEDVT